MLTRTKIQEEITTAKHNIEELQKKQEALEKELQYWKGKKEAFECLLGEFDTPTITSDNNALPNGIAYFHMKDPKHFID